MDSMVESVARALWRKAHPVNTHNDYTGQLADGYGEAEDFGWRDYEDDARAAIEAMREPTEAMRDAGALRVWLDKKTSDQSSEAVASDVYTVMITAALEPQADVRVAEGRPAGPSVPNKE